MKTNQYQKPEVQVFCFISGGDVLTFSVTTQDESWGGVQDDVFDSN